MPAYALPPGENRGLDEEASIRPLSESNYLKNILKLCGVSRDSCSPKRRVTDIEISVQNVEVFYLVRVEEERGDETDLNDCLVSYGDRVL